MVNRKDFLRQSLRAFADMASGLVKPELATQLTSTPIYPPGAVEDYRDVCTSCGDCVQACPEGAIRLVPDRFDDKELPNIIPSTRACAICDTLPCIDACQKEALVPPVGNLFPAIGLAQVQTEHCLAFNGSTCMICFDACPLKGSALEFKQNRPVVIAETCTGCGQCEYVCPTATKGIVVAPR